MAVDFLRKPRSREEEEKRRLVAAALRSLSDQQDTLDKPEGKLLNFPQTRAQFGHMVGVLTSSSTTNPAETATMFLDYWRQLAAEMRVARNAHRRAMAAEDDWDFPRLIRNDLEFLRILVGMRWMAFRFRFGFVPDSSAISTLVRDALTFTSTA